MVSTLEPGSKRGAVFTTALLPDTLAAIQLAGKIPLIKSCSKYESIQIASQEDIAAMKIEAVMGRGSRRDFIDLYFLSKGFSLEEILEFYNQKYGLLEKNYYPILRSIGYFEDAEDRDDQMPRMILDVDWNEVKQFFTQESTRLSRKGLGI